MSAIYTTIPDGTEITVLEILGDWIRIEAEERDGYVYVGDVEGLPEEPAPEPEEPGQETKPEKKILIFTSRRSVMRPGDIVTLTSILEGFEDCEEIYYQWECDKGDGFKPVKNANEDTYSYAATIESLNWGWRLRVYFR